MSSLTWRLNLISFRSAFAGMHLFAVVLPSNVRLRCWLLAGMLAAGFGWNNNAAGADLDSVREPIVRPNEETVKKWLHGLEITVEKRSLWFDRKEKLDSTKVRDHAVTGGSIFQKPAPFANYGITTRSFGYPDGKGKANRYVVVIEYEWSAGLTGIDRKFTKVVSLIGP